MKYCTKCGAQIHDEAVVCVNCGCNTGYVAVNSTSLNSQNSGMITTIKVLMIIGTVYFAFMGFCIPLAWCLPMTLSYFKKIENGEPISMNFKICTLLFVNTIAGILMLCSED